MFDILNLIWDNFYWNYFNCHLFIPPGLACVAWIIIGLIGVVSTIGLIVLKDKEYSFENNIWLFSISFSILFPGLYGLFLDIAEYLIGGKLYWIFYEPLVKGFFYPFVTSPILFIIILLLRWLIKKIRLFLGFEKRYKY